MQPSVHDWEHHGSKTTCKNVNFSFLKIVPFVNCTMKLCASPLNFFPTTSIEKMGQGLGTRLQYIAMLLVVGMKLHPQNIHCVVTYSMGIGSDCCMATNVTLTERHQTWIAMYPEWLRRVRGYCFWQVHDTEEHWTLTRGNTARTETNNKQWYLQSS